MFEIVGAIGVLGAIRVIKVFPLPLFMSIASTLGLFESDSWVSLLIIVIGKGNIRVKKMNPYPWEETKVQEK